MARSNTRQREAIRHILHEALDRWCIDQELGSSEALEQWIEQFLSERQIAELVEAAS